MEKFEVGDYVQIPPNERFVFWVKNFYGSVYRIKLLNDRDLFLLETLDGETLIVPTGNVGSGKAVEIASVYLRYADPRDIVKWKSERDTRGK